MNIEKFNAKMKKGFSKFPKNFSKSPWFQIQKRICIQVPPKQKNEIFTLLKAKTPISRSLIFDLDSLCFNVNTIDTFDISLSVNRNNLLILPNIFARVASMIGQLFYKVKGFNYIIFVTSCGNLSDIKGCFTDAILLEPTENDKKLFERDLADDVIDVFTAQPGILISSLLEIIEEQTNSLASQSLFDDSNSDESDYKEEV